MAKSSELQYLTVDDQEDEYQDVVESDAFAIHMNAMTAEHLHSKSEIAVELARRDMKVESLERERDALSEKYNELLYCVANKYEGETRHETAKRIILNNQSNKGAGESEKGASQ